MPSRLILSTLIVLIPLLSFAQENWPRWRGPSQDGHHRGLNLPLEWDNSNIDWRLELPGRGQSAPTIWGERIFLTAQKGDGAERIVFCVNKNSGKIVWQHTAWKGSPEPAHALNGWASATCATDGEHVYAFFGIGGLHCYTVEGQPVWSKELGDFQGPWGTAASPVIVRDLLIQNCDADANARLIAFDKRTGKEVWNTKRENARGWSTPILIEDNGREELVLNGDSRVTAYDPESGAELWFCKSFNGRGSPTAVWGNGLIHMINGKPGDGYAVRPGGSGDVTETHLAWHSRRPKGRDLPSPVVIGKYLLSVNMGGIASCFESPTGNEVWTGRIGGKHIAAPVAYQGRAVFIDESGKAYVVVPGPEMKIEHTNSLGNRDGELFRTPITPNEGNLYIRSTGALYKLKKS